MRKKIYIDTNVMLDLLGEREEFYLDAAKIASLADQKKIMLISSPISYATVNYFLSKFENSNVAREKLRKFKLVSEGCTIDESIVEKSLNSNFSDFVIAHLQVMNHALCFPLATDGQYVTTRRFGLIFDLQK